MWTPLRIAALLVFGAIGGILADQIHVQFGVLSYPRPSPLGIGMLFGQAWWVGPLFAGATVLIVAGATPFARAARPRRPEPFLNPFATGTLWFVGAYFASGLWFRHPEILTAAYVALFLARVAPRPDRGPLVGYALLLAAAGSGIEAALSKLELFHYARPDWIVPMWLPGLYLHGAPLAIALADWLDRRRSARPRM